jgi:DNA-binding CsgD family transcriptional regulator
VDIVTVTDLGREISSQVRQVVPHEGYLLVGLDPVTRAGCFLTVEHSYGAQARSRLAIESALDRLSPVSVLVTGRSDQRPSARLRDLTAAGFGSEMRLELTHGGRVWGALILLRERGSTPFSAADTAHAKRLAQPLALALKRFVASTPLSGIRSELPPDVIVVGPDDEIKAITPTGRDRLRTLGFAPDDELDDDDALFSSIWNITYMARRGGAPALSRLLTSKGWVALHAQLLDSATPGEVAVTIQAASAAMLLPAVACWYDITRREQAVIEQTLEGLPVKHIARRLELSPHTVSDHFKAIYHKIGVTSREELIARLSR